MNKGSMRLVVKDGNKVTTGPKSPGSGGGGGGNMELDTRVARIEVHVEHINTSITEIKSDIKDIKAEIKSDFRWTLGLLGTLLVIFTSGLLGLAALMAHGFHWI